MADPLADAWRQARLDFAGAPPADMALAGGGSFHPACPAAGEGAPSGGRPPGGVIRLRYCGGLVEVDWPGGEVSAASRLNRAENILVLQYLHSRGAVPPRGRWLAFLDLPGGSHHLQPFLDEAVAPLAAGFGARPRALVEAGLRLGGRELALGSAAVEVPALPKVPVAAVVWAPSAEFPARATVMFDVTAPLHLATASLYVLGIEVSLRLLKEAGAGGETA